MGAYESENGKLLERLRSGHTKEIHGVRMTVKDIPDPMEGTVLDPRVYEARKAEAEKGDPWAECLEIPIQQIRDDPGYPNRDITSGTVQKRQWEITTRNGGTPVFAFRPEGGRDKKPALLFLHGGAFIEGSTRAVANFCKLLAELADIAVFSVDYRLAPENRFPAGLYDCYDTFDWMYRQADELELDRQHLAVGGDSAGGTLAIGCCILERDAVAAGKLDKNRICYEALLYPAVLVDNFKMEDYRWRLADYEIPDDDLLAQGAAVSLKVMADRMPCLYMGKEGHVKDPLAAPLCQETLAGLPQTLMVLCEYDFLRLSGEAFARKLIRDGVSLRAILYRGMDHAFIDRTGDCPQAYDAAAEMAEDLKKLCAD